MCCIAAGLLLPFETHPPPVFVGVILVELIALLIVSAAIITRLHDPQVGERVGS
jgi:hypothetical protein